LRRVDHSRLLRFNVVGEIVEKRLLRETSKPIGVNEALLAGEVGNRCARTP